MNRNRHPSKRQLHRWLRHEQPQRVSDHIGVCEACTEYLEIEVGADETVTHALRLVTAPPDGLDARTAVAMTDVIRRNEALGVFAELLGLGWRTGKTIVESQHRKDDDL